MSCIYITENNNITALYNLFEKYKSRTPILIYDEFSHNHKIRRFTRWTRYTKKIIFGVDFDEHNLQCQT